MNKIRNLKLDWESNAKGSLDEDNWNEDYSSEIRLSVGEMRKLITLLIHADSLLSRIGQWGLLKDGIDDRDATLRDCIDTSYELRSLYESK
jgi:hypothetical protein